MMREGSVEIDNLSKAWEAWGIPSQSEKAVINELEMDSLGCRIDGSVGLIGPPRNAVAQLLGLTSWLSRKGEWTPHQARILGGKWVRMFQFRRELSSCFDSFWTFLHPEADGAPRRGVPDRVVEDLVLALCLLPLAIFDLRVRPSPLVVASDASQDGLGVCRTTVVTPAGMEAITEMRALENHSSQEVGVIELFEHLGCVRQALVRLKVRPGAFAVCGTSAQGQRVLEQAWPEIRVLPGKNNYDKQDLASIVELGPRVRLWVLSVSDGLMLKEGTERVMTLANIAEDLCSMVPNASVELMCQCPVEVDATRRDEISDLLGIKPIWMNHSQSSTKFNRLVWVTWRVAPGEALVNCTREYDKFTFQNDESTARTPCGQPAEPVIEAAEVSLGFKAGHTQSAMVTSALKDRPGELRALRADLLAGAGNAVAASCLLKDLLAQRLAIKSAASDLCKKMAAVTCEYEVAAAGIELVRELARRQTHRGREIRRPGPEEHPGLLPRATIDPQWWRWRKIFGTPWQDPTEHINVLELRAFLASVQWRLRSCNNIHSKGLHLLDSIAVLGALAKGRSSSRRLGPLIGKVNSLMLAASFTGLLAYVRTDLNPADAPSRRIKQ